MPANNQVTAQNPQPRMLNSIITPMPSVAKMCPKYSHFECALWLWWHAFGREHIRAEESSVSSRLRSEFEILQTSGP